MVEIVVAMQNLPRGIVIPEDGVGIQPWPREALPEPGNYFLADEMGDVVGRIARTDIFRGSPILQRQIVDNLYEIARSGSDAAAIMNALPQDRTLGGRCRSRWTSRGLGRWLTVFRMATMWM